MGGWDVLPCWERMPQPWVMVFDLAQQDFKARSVCWPESDQAVSPCRRNSSSNSGVTSSGSLCAIPCTTRVSHSSDRSKHRLRREPIEQKNDGRAAIGVVDGTAFLRLPGSIRGRQSRAAETDSIDFAGQQPRRSGAPTS